MKTEHTVQVYPSVVDRMRISTTSKLKNKTLVTDRPPSGRDGVKCRKRQGTEGACVYERKALVLWECYSKIPQVPPCAATWRGASLLPEEGSKLLEFPSMEASPHPTM